LSSQQQIQAATQYAINALQSSGYNANTSDAVKATREIVAEKVSPIPSWALPVGIGAAGLLAVTLLMRRR
jgi:hypothetical protein